MVLALVARGGFFLLVKWLALRAGQRQGGVFRIPPPYLWTPLSPQRVKGCSPLTSPKKKSKRKKASRCAKTGCGSQRLLRYRSHPAGRGPNSSSLFPPLAAVVAVALFSRFSNLLLRSRLYALAERKVQRKRNTIGGAVNRRSPKNAFSEAASIFGLRQLLRGLKGASSPFLVDPARRNRWWFSGSLLPAKENISLNEKALYPAPPARKELHLQYTKRPSSFHEENLKVFSAFRKGGTASPREHVIRAAAECGASLPSARGCWRQHPAQRPALRPAPRRCSCAA